MIPTLPILIITAVMIPVILELFVRRKLRDPMEDSPKTREAFQLYHRYFPLLLAITILLMWSVFESAVIDDIFLNSLGTDYTPLIHSLEGDAVVRIQNMMWSPAASVYFSFMYMVMYPVTFYVSIFLFMFLDQKKVVKMLALGYVVIYLAALPFYLLFPVNEVWITSTRYHAYNLAHNLPIYDYSDVRGVLFEFSEANQASYIMNSLNNCFPSLHTAISTFVPMVMFATNRRRWGYFTLWIALSIVIGIFYLGTHWIIDMFAGLATSSFALYVVVNLDYELGYPLSPYDIRWKGKKVRWLSRKKQP